MIFLLHIFFFFGNLYYIFSNSKIKKNSFFKKNSFISFAEEVSKKKDPNPFPFYRELEDELNPGAAEDRSNITAYYSREDLDLANAKLAIISQNPENTKIKTPVSPFTFTHGLENSDSFNVGPRVLPSSIHSMIMHSGLFNTATSVKNFTMDTILYAKDYERVKDFSDIDIKHYPYGLKTPEFSDLQLIKQVLSKHPSNLSETQYYTLNEILNKRLRLMDLAGTYYYTRAYTDFLEFLQQAQNMNPKNFEMALELQEPSLRTLQYFGAWNVIEFRLKLAQGAMWEDWKEMHGYHNQYTMVAQEDYFAVKQDMYVHAQNETLEQYDEDHLSGVRRDRVSNRHIGEVFYIERMNQARAHAFLEGMEYRLTYRENVLASFGFWGFRDYFMYRNRWPIPHKEFMFIHTRYKHLELVMFQEFVTKKAIYYAQKMKLASNHILRVIESRNTLKDKKLSITEKALKILNGDIWVRDLLPQIFSNQKIDPNLPEDVQEEIYWSKNLRDGSPPEEMTSLTQVDHNNSRYTRNYTGQYKLELYLPLEEYWNYLNPTLLANKFFFFKYFDPWLEFLKKTERPSMGDSKNPNIFWFKYSHSEISFLRCADGSRIEPVRFQSGWLFRQFERRMQRLWLKTYKTYSTAQNRNLWYGYNPLFKKLYSQLPLEIWPVSISTKFYEYSGPATWVVIPAFAMLDETDPYDSNQYVGTFVGPSWTPTNLSYKHWMECFEDREWFFTLYKTYLYFMKTSVLIKIPLFLSVILMLFFTSILLFWIFLNIQSSNLVERRYWPCFKTLAPPDLLTKAGKEVTLMLYINDNNTAAERNNPAWNIPAKSRNNLNILIFGIISILLGLFVHLPLYQGPCNFFIPSVYAWDLFAFFSSFGATLLPWYVFHYWLEAYFDEIETEENFEDFSDGWKNEREVTEELELAYEKKYYEEYTKRFGKPPKTMPNGDFFRFQH